jgi:hypothetical protein
VSILLDAGPALNFLAVRQENILIQAAGSHGLQLAAPERVDREVEGQANSERFRRTRVRNTWRSMRNAGRIHILDDDLTTKAFADAVARVSGMPAGQRVKERKSLGEIMVISHASVLAQAGQSAYVLIDERDGRDRASQEVAWLRRQSAPGKMVLWHTLQVLHEADRNPGWINGGLDGEAVFTQMRPYDEGLQKLSWR